MSMDGRAVVVTGAGQGLGRAFARHLAQVGAAVVVNDVDGDLAASTAEEIRSAGGRAVASGHSVADAEQARAIVELCVRAYGQLDGLVNNAGVSYEALPAEEDPRHAHELIQVNVLGVIYTGLAAIRAMAGRRGSIVNISSGASLGQRSLGTYAASKGAVASLTYSWALDLEAARIRVNAVCPVAHTRMVRSSERALGNCPPDRTPEMIAPLVSFLLSDLSLGVTGQMIRCNGPQLHVVGQPYLKAPILERDSWDADSVERAFSEVFHAHLEPYGLEKRLPPMLRKWLSWRDTADRTVRN